MKLEIKYKTLDYGLGDIIISHVRIYELMNDLLRVKFYDDGVIDFDNVGEVIEYDDDNEYDSLIFKDNTLGDNMSIISETEHKVRIDKIMEHLSSKKIAEYTPLPELNININAFDKMSQWEQHIYVEKQNRLNSNVCENSNL